MYIDSVHLFIETTKLGRKSASTIMYIFENETKKQLT